MTKKLNTREVVAMCQRGDAKDTRKMLLELLSVTTAEAKTELRSLLDLLLLVETYEGRWQAALLVLERRRALGYRKAESRMDSALQAATFLYRTGQYMEARDELIAVLREQRSLNWAGLLPALHLYVQLDDECQTQMASILVANCQSVIKRFGIPVAFDGSPERVGDGIKSAHSKFHADSLAYSALLYRVFGENTADGRERLLLDIQDYARGVRVEFFRRQATDLLNELTPKSASGPTKAGNTRRTR
jgi:hypothetical protein